MAYTSAYGLGPGTTPFVIRWLIGITCILSICTAMLNPLFLNYLQIQGPNYLFSLSWYGLKSGYLWQPVTYLFVEEGFDGVSFNLLISLFFQMSIVWIMGSPLAERFGGYSFTVFYLLCGIISGLAAILTAPLFGLSPFFMGPGASVVAVLIAWTMMHPESELLLFFLVPVKAKWLLAGVFGALILVNLSQGNIPALIFYLTAGIFGYIYAVLCWNMESLFSWTRQFDDYLAVIKSKIWKENSSSTTFDQSKIIDLHTGKPFLDDEAFMDAMLTKISEKGEHTLTWSERRRLRKISERTRQK